MKKTLRRMALFLAVALPMAIFSAFPASAVNENANRTYTLDAFLRASPANVSLGSASTVGGVTTYTGTRVYIDGALEGIASASFYVDHSIVTASGLASINRVYNVSQSVSNPFFWAITGGVIMQGSGQKAYVRYELKNIEWSSDDEKDMPEGGWVHAGYLNLEFDALTFYGKWY